MPHFRLVQIALATLATVFTATLTTTPARAQVWTVDEPGAGVASAHICPLGEEGTDDFLCFRLECTTLEPLHFVLDIAGRDATREDLAVTVGVDGGDVGVLTFSPHPATGYTRYSASYDPRLHDEMVNLLERGLRASLAIDWPEGRQDVAMGLTGSADSLLTAMRTCPKPAPPVENPTSLALGEVVAACSDLGGTVAMEPGFERREDLDGDGRKDIVIDYAAAACSEAPTLNCGSGGCTVGFFLARDEGYVRMFSDVIRGYEVFPGGFLALDLHGTACGLYGFEACRKVFDVAGDSPVLVEEIAGPEAETMTVAKAGAAAAEDTEEGAAEGAGENALEAEGEDAGALVVAVTEGVTVEPEPGATEGGTEPGAAEGGTEQGAAVAPPAPEAAPVVPGLGESSPDGAAPDSAAPASEAPATEAPPTETPEDENVAVAALTPEAAPTPEPTPSPAPTPSPTPAAEPMADAGGNADAVPTAAAGGDDEEGPTSRHDAGPAPAVPADARFRGDGTRVLPEETAQ